MRYCPIIYRNETQAVLNFWESMRLVFLKKREDTYLSNINYMCVWTHFLLLCRLNLLSLWICLLKYLRLIINNFEDEMCPDLHFVYKKPQWATNHFLFPFLHSVISLTEYIGIVRVGKYRVVCLCVCVCVCVSVCSR